MNDTSIRSIIASTAWWKSHRRTMETPQRTLQSERRDCRRRLNCTCSEFNPISVISFLCAFNLSYDSNGVYKGTEMCLFHFFLIGRPASHSMLVDTLTRIHRSVRPRQREECWSRTQKWWPFFSKPTTSMMSLPRPMPPCRGKFNFRPCRHQIMRMLW